MKKDSTGRSDLERKLKQLSKAGIQADRHELLKDMCSQFPDPREWIREYVVNGRDAGATVVTVAGFEREKSYSIVVEDDGSGMDRQGVLDFCTVFRSVKSSDFPGEIGCHGIGKLSPAAMPGQCGFSMKTSTGTESLRVKTGSLLSNNPPLKVERIEPVPERGTRFVITFKKRKKDSPKINSELREYASILHKYLRYLGLNIIVFEIDGDDLDSPRWAKPVRKILGAWSDCTERFSRHYSLKLDGKEFEVVIGFGSGCELYVNRVLVSRQYDILARALYTDPQIPHLKIRANIDGPDVELNFGRNRLNDEEMLKPLAGKIREKALPEYFDEIASCYYNNSLFNEHKVHPYEVEDIACALMFYTCPPNSTWCQFPLFTAKTDDSRLSLMELKDIVSRKGVLYIDEGDSEYPGLDYSAFDAPVLSCKQPERGLEFLKLAFSKQIVKLDSKDAVLEAPNGTTRLSRRERRFEQHLGFDPLVTESSSKNKRKKNRSAEREFNFSIEDLLLTQGVFKESESAQHALSSVKWRVNFLVQFNGEPCITHRFLFTKNTVVLNLHHPDTGQLVSLFETAPDLAAHWAMAMCLAEGNKILPHLTPQTREDLIIVDAMAKCGIPVPHGATEDKGCPRGKRKTLRDFLRNIADPEFGL
jgi:hypothetical protein